MLITRQPSRCPNSKARERRVEAKALRNPRMVGRRDGNSHPSTVKETTTETAPTSATAGDWTNQPGAADAPITPAPAWRYNSSPSYRYESRTSATSSIGSISKDPVDVEPALGAGVGRASTNRHEARLFNPRHLTCTSSPVIQFPHPVATDEKRGQKDSLSKWAEPIPSSRDIVDLATAPAGAFAEKPSSISTCPTFKDVPGHGRSGYGADSRTAFAISSGELQTLDRQPLIGFTSAVDGWSVATVAEVGAPAPTNDMQLPLAPKTTRLLRDHSPFDAAKVIAELAKLGSITRHPVASEEPMERTLSRLPDQRCTA